jgi:protein-S-isoprenylcysteine O-methyltransferase Ste14
MLFTIDNKSDLLILGIIIFIIGMLIGINGIKEHNKKFNIRPDIQENSILITTGIYSYIRHPMYSSVVFGMLGILISFFSIEELIIYIFLVVVMIIKLHYEENLWVCHTEEYIKYQAKTKKLIPFIY